MELNQKIQAAVAAAMAQQFPSMKLPEGQTAKFDFHIEAKPDGGFLIHSHDPNSTPIAGASHDDIELPFAGKIAGVLGKYFLPEFSEALAQHGSGDMQVTVNQNVTFATSSFKTTAQDAVYEMVLEAAINGGADALVTYNIRDFAGAAERFKISVLHPAELLKKVNP